MFKPQFTKLRLEQLEYRLVLSISTGSAPSLTPPQTAYQSLVEANVVGEHVFYNDSVYDGNNSVASAADDAAIAPDKTALLPGQTATFANYTSYSSGINGIMVDIAGLPQNVTANDFAFAVGNNSTPSSWTSLTVAPTVTVRWGAGENGSARVELVWPNNAIENEWLQVTVLADADTGLSANTVFYFGNAIGSTGDSTTSAQVTRSDLNAVTANKGPATITSPYDFNRDGQVDAQDQVITRTNANTPATALQLITAPAIAPTTQYATEQPAFMEAQDGFEYLTTPIIVETNDGTLICVAQAQDTAEPTSIGVLVEKTSTDGGQTWSPLSVVATDPNYPANFLSMGSMVVDTKTNTVFLVYTSADYDTVTTATSNYQVWLVSSSNDGKTWSAPEDITSSVVQSGWQYVSVGPGNGIQLTVGADTGRLVIGIYYRFVANENSASDPGYSTVMYSDDDGTTWQSVAGPDPTDPDNAGNIEPVITQLPNGELYMNTRLKYASAYDARGYSYSSDGGLTWTNFQFNTQLTVDSVGGSLLSLDNNTLLFAAPDDPDTFKSPDDSDGSGARYQMTIWASFDNGQTWTEEKVVNYEYASFSCMVNLGHDTGMLVFMAGQTPPNGVDGNNTFEKIELTKFNLTGLLSPQPDQFIWNFNEQPIGDPAPIGGSSIRDDGVLDQRGTVQSPGGGIPYYVAGDNGGEALRIVDGSNVLLSPEASDGLQFGTGESFTFQFLMRTTSANGVLLGNLPGDPGYTFSLVNGQITLSLSDGTNTSTITGTTIDDGNWHTVVGVRNTATQTISLYVDGTLVATGADTTGSLVNPDNVTLGSYADGSDQLDLDIDQVVATRAALSPSQFLPSSYVPPQTLPAPTTPANSVLNLPGVNFYLGPYDERHYFEDAAQSDPLLLQPSAGTAAISAIDFTDNYDVTGKQGGSVYYESDSVVGSYWSSQNSTGWTVENSNGTDSPNQNFDFVQNSETFTISDVFNLPQVPTNGDVYVVGNNQSTSALPGFELLIDSSGNLNFSISNGSGNGTSLIDQNLASYSSKSSLPQLQAGTWYQIVIVGNGPGTPLQYYLTPITASQVQSYQTKAAMTGIATPTPTGATQDLQIANVSDSAVSSGTPTLNFKDLAIFNTALSASQVQQMFTDEATLVTTAPVVTASDNMANYTLGGSPVVIDSDMTVSSTDADLTGATLTISHQTIQPGDRLVFANQSGITGSYNASTGTLTLTGSATPAQYQTALESVQFSTASASLLPRSISVTVNAGSTSSNLEFEQVNQIAVGPIVAASGTQATYTIGGAAALVDGGLTVISADADITGATLQITNPLIGDQLNFANQNGITGSYNSATATLTLSGAATPAQYQAALRSVTFSNTTNAITVSRTVSVAAFDVNSSPASSNSVLEQVNVAAPSTVTGTCITSPVASLTFTEGAPQQAVDAQVAIVSSDANLSGATVTITSGLLAGDTLNFINQNGIKGSYNSGTGVLTLTGVSSVANYQAALRSVTFQNSTNPTTQARSISTQVIDGSNWAQPVIEIVNAVPPLEVTGIYVMGTGAGNAWSPTFLSYLGSHGEGSSSYGFNLADGSTQLSDLPWFNLNTITVTFNQAPSQISANSLELLTGSGNQLLSTAGTTFTEINSTTYQWVLPAVLGNGHDLVSLASSTSSFGTPILDSLAAGLDGDFATGGTLPSGNGLAGGTFNLFFNVLPGDVNRDGIDNGSDLSQVHPLATNIRVTSTRYSPFDDVNGDGTINVTDLSAVRPDAGRLTTGSPTAPADTQVGSLATSVPAAGGLDTGTALGVIESSNTSPAVSSASTGSAASSTSSSSPTSVPSTASTSTSASGSSLGNTTGGASAAPVSSSLLASDPEATDQAISGFDLADLWV